MTDDWQRIVEFVRLNVASDVYLNNCAVKARVDGKVVRLSSAEDFTQDEFERLVRVLVEARPDLLPVLETAMPSLDFSTQMHGMRFRVNIVRARGKFSVSLRPLPENPPSPESVGLPEKVTKAIIDAPGGLVLITGATGSGKTTTLAAILETINEARPVKIITIEAPIEFIFSEKLADIAQREVGVDCPSFHVGARDAWRQNPDIISIAEIRDQETAIVALQAAETGHLVFGTLHASSVEETPERLLKLLPADMRDRARDVFATVLVAVLSQILVAKGRMGEWLSGKFFLTMARLRPCSKSRAITSWCTICVPVERKEWLIAKRTFRVSDPRSNHANTSGGCRRSFKGRFLSARDRSRP